MSLGSFIRGILKTGTSSKEDLGNTKPSRKSSNGRDDTSSQDAESGPIAISFSDAKHILAKYKPLVEELNRRGIDYCIVGGLGVMIQGLDKSTGKVRLTRDIDVMVDDSFGNSAFVETYLEAFSDNSEQAAMLTRHLQGGGGTSSQEVGDFDNFGLKPLSSKRIGKDVPGVDVVRRLNGFTLSDLKSEFVSIDGTVYHVATVDTLKEMKTRTVNMLKASFADSTRPQDFLDLQKLYAIQASQPKPASPKQQGLNPKDPASEKAAPYAVDYNRAVHQQNQSRRSRR